MVQSGRDGAVSGYTGWTKFNVDSVREDSRRVGIILASAGLLSAALKEGNLWIGACLVTACLALMQSVTWRTKMTSLGPAVGRWCVVRRHAAVALAPSVVTDNINPVYGKP